MEPDNAKWYHVSLCQGMDLNWFYDDYEDDPVFAETMDAICLSCPVRKMCLLEGVNQKEYGLWGGVFLNNGKTDKSRNAHKTQDIWDEIRSGV